MSIGLPPTVRPPPRIPPGMRRTPLANAALRLCLLLVATRTAAQETQAPAASFVPELQTVTIVAAAPLPGVGVPRDTLPYSVQIVTSKAIDDAHAGNLADLMLRRMTGVNLNEIQGSPFQADLTYRGFRASSILGTPQGLSVYLDGIRINEPFGDVVNWDMIPESALASVMLVPGSNPAYGLNTMGGALALRTKSGLTDPGFEADVSIGSYGRKRMDLAYGVRTDAGWHAFAAGTLFDESGWRDHSGGRLGNVFVKIGRSKDDTSWDLSVLHGESRLRGNGLVPGLRMGPEGTLPGLYEANRAAVYTYPDITSNQVTQVAFHGSHWFDNSTELSLLVYTRLGRRDTVNGDISDDYREYAEACGDGFQADGSPVGSDCGFTRAQGAALHPAVLNRTATSQQSYGLGLSLSKEAGTHKLSFGTTFDATRMRYAQYTQQAFLTGDRGVVADPDAPTELFSGVRGHSNAFGLYASDTWSILPTTHLTGSLRWNRIAVTSTLQNNDGSSKPTERFIYSSVNPALGIAQQLGGGLTLFGGFSQSNRAPTAIELGCADPAQPCRLPTGLQSDPYLKQVISRTLEIGTRWQPSQDFMLSASLYRTTNRDDILFLRAPNSQQGYFSNFDRTRNQGLDLSASKRMGNVTVRLGYSYLQATYDADGQLLAGERTVNIKSGTRIAGLPRHTLKLGLDWRPVPAFTVGGELLAVSRSPSSGNEDGLVANTAAGGTPRAADWGTAGHAIFNLSASFRPFKALELYARVLNVFNRRYETYGMVAADLFPGGRLAQPHAEPADVSSARFVAPGAPRTVVIGLRYRM